jgi:hypothetical protein
MSGSSGMPVIDFDHLSSWYAADLLSVARGGQPSGSERSG